MGSNGSRVEVLYLRHNETIRNMNVPKINVTRESCWSLDEHCCPEPQIRATQCLHVFQHESKARVAARHQSLKDDEGKVALSWGTMEHHIAVWKGIGKRKVAQGYIEVVNVDADGPHNTDGRALVVADAILEEHGTKRRRKTKAQTGNESQRLKAYSYFRGQLRKQPGACDKRSGASAEIEPSASSAALVISGSAMGTQEQVYPEAADEENCVKSIPVEEALRECKTSGNKRSGVQHLDALAMNIIFVSLFQCPSCIDL